MSENLVDGLLRELARCRELLGQYRDLGPVGRFGYIMIEQDIQRAEKAMGEGDLVAMIGAYKALEGCE